jgi:hypothetical protein
VFGLGASNGVSGYSPSGRGGSFSGGEAALQLIPSSRASHPRSGLAGDMFVDSRKRLWFCIKSGSRATWKQVSFV